LLISDQVRAFLEQPHFAVMGTINADGTPQLTVMWYALDRTSSCSTRPAAC
jgi:predicted pyridoxine 5'-phosphate oxidase superfamily flavin-nucleotide-binding protein